MAEGGRGQGAPLPKVRRHSEAGERSVTAEICGTNINYLPDELMVNIFSYISFNELVETVPYVCVRWRRLAHDPLLWLVKEYIITGSSSPLNGRSCCGVICSKCVHCRCDTTDAEVLRTAAALPQLRTLTLMRGVEGSFLHVICRKWPNLTNLEFHFSQQIDCALMKHMFKVCPNIQKLKLGSSTLVHRWCAEQLSRLKRLRILELFLDRSHRLPVYLAPLADACPQLEEVHVDWSYVEARDMEYFLKIRKDSLTSATLHWRVGCSEKRCIPTMLKQCETSLRRLRLLHFDMPAEVEAAAFGALGELHSLQELSAQYLMPRQPQLMSLAFRPGCLTQLRRLLLQYATRLQDETVITISQGCPHLRELRISASVLITDIALSEIHRLKHLEILELSGCNGLGGTAVAYISQLPALHTLVLQRIKDLSKLQPSLGHIVDVRELRCLDILMSCNIAAVPFDEFPGRLVKLRELRVSYEGGNVFTELQCKMPLLKISKTAWLTEEDFPMDNGADDGGRVGEG